MSVHPRVFAINPSAPKQWSVLLKDQEAKQLTRMAIVHHISDSCHYHFLLLHGHFNNVLGIIIICYIETPLML